MDSTTRLAVVDDTDSRIQYSNGWSFTTHGSEEDTEEFGPSVNHTSHDLTTSGGSLSFEFNGGFSLLSVPFHLSENDKGTYVQALGIIDTTNGKEAPTWSCSIDGKAIPVDLSDSTDTNLYHSNDNLCEAQDLASGTHVLTLNVTAPSSSPYLFGLDSIAYQPAQFDETQIIYIPHTDNNISTSGSAWLLDPSSLSTSTVGAQLVFTFTGRQILMNSARWLIWLTGIGVQALGQSNEDDTPNSKGATYAIDGGPAVSFDIPTSQTSFFYNVNLFDVSNLSFQEHTVTMTFTGDPTKAPLAVDYFFVYNPPPITSTNNNTTQVGPPGSGPTNTAGATEGSTPTSAIIAGVVGALVLLILAALLPFCLRRRRRTKRLSEESKYYTHSATNFAVSASPFQESALVPPTPSSLYAMSPGALSTAGSIANLESGSPARSKEQPSGMTVLRWEGEQSAARAMDSGMRIRESQSLPPLYTET